MNMQSSQHMFNLPVKFIRTKSETTRIRKTGDIFVAIAAIYNQKKN
jgi:hypothetical protein